MQRTTVTVICDLPEGHTGEPDANTVTFSLDGKTYEMDLCPPHERALRAGLEPFVELARKTTIGLPKPKRSMASRRRSGRIRDWARRNGIDIEDRGRLPAQIVEKYEAAH